MDMAEDRMGMAEAEAVGMQTEEAEVTDDMGCTCMIRICYNILHSRFAIVRPRALPAAGIF